MTDLVKQDMTHLWAVTGDIVAPDDTKIDSGWAVETVPRQWWNWMQNRVDTNVAYMLQKGIPEWDSGTEYIINKSYVQYLDVIYKCIATNTGDIPASVPASWKKAFVESSASMEALKSVTPAADRLAYFTNGTTATVTPFTAFARTLLDDTTAAAARTTLGAQALDATLTAMAGVATGINSLIYFTGTDVAASTVLSTFARTLIDDIDAATMRTTLELVKQTSPSDATAGRVLLNGAHGLGATSAHSIAGLQDDPLSVPNGLYVEVASSVGNPGLLGAAAGYIKHHRGSLSVSQLFETAATPVRQFQRTYASGVWSAWVEFWHNGNLTRAVNAPLIAEDTDGTQVPDLASIRWLYSAVSTVAGSADWNDQVLPGVSSRLMNATDANGPGFPGYAYCRVTAYSAINGTSSLLQEAIGYGGGTSARYARRHRQAAADWLPWVEEWNTATFNPDLKANLASPALAGVPTTPTAAVGTNTTQIASTAFVSAEIANDAILKTGGGSISKASQVGFGNAALNIASTGVAGHNAVISFATASDGAAIVHDDGVNGLRIETSTPGTLANLAAAVVNATTVNATTVTGSGAGLTALNASNLTSGTLPDGRLSGAYTGLGSLSQTGTSIVNTMTGSGKSWLVVNNGADFSIRENDTSTTRLNIAAGGVITGNGFGLNTLDASKISSGTIADAHLPATISSSITGNAATATTLQTARTINGISFNGSANITVADATKLPLTGGTMTGATFHGDSVSSVWGTGSDMQIYHNGTNTYLDHGGTGDLIVRNNRTDGRILMYTDNDLGVSELVTQFGTSGVNGCILYAGNVAKLTTTDTGVTIAGTATATTFSGSGASLTALNAANVSTGTLAVLRGGTGVTTATGGGSNVLSVSPTFTGAPLAPTAAPGTNTTQLATTAFVQAAITEGQASAWVNFNGTGTVAIRDSFNVSSITDNGTGLYTVNFASAMSNASYATCCSVRLVVGHVSTAVNVSSGTAPTTSGVRIETANTGSGRVAADASEVYVAVFGG